ncbi:hypothetical protein PROFUN_14765 [Planoprotostelium fungivorum]|uniref:C3H1-type domain-containing protein n=1 Tax=Planoprotostelium fungivorum TaxID=1890364 RepID=A0A2P6MYN9_9EUKA|nr:hypothetical protein PROFUN_14765 [Planoprotostelium fungivorum]
MTICFYHVFGNCKGNPCHEEHDLSVDHLNDSVQDPHNTVHQINQSSSSMCSHHMVGRCNRGNDCQHEHLLDQSMLNQENLGAIRAYQSKKRTAATPSNALVVQKQDKQEGKQLAKLSNKSKDHGKVNCGTTADRHSCVEDIAVMQQKMRDGKMKQKLHDLKTKQYIQDSISKALNDQVHEFKLKELQNKLEQMEKDHQRDMEIQKLANKPVTTTVVAGYPYHYGTCPHGHKITRPLLCLMSVYGLTRA